MCLHKNSNSLNALYTFIDQYLILDFQEGLFVDGCWRRARRARPTSFGMRRLDAAFCAEVPRVEPRGTKRGQARALQKALRRSDTAPSMLNLLEGGALRRFRFGGDVWRTPQRGVPTFREIRVVPWLTLLGAFVAWWFNYLLSAAINSSSLLAMLCISLWVGGSLTVMPSWAMALVVAALAIYNNVKAAAQRGVAGSDTLLSEEAVYFQHASKATPDPDASDPLNPGSAQIHEKPRLKRGFSRFLWKIDVFQRNVDLPKVNVHLRNINVHLQNINVYLQNINVHLRNINGDLQNINVHLPQVIVSLKNMIVDLLKVSVSLKKVIVDPLNVTAAPLFSKARKSLTG